MLLDPLGLKLIGMGSGAFARAGDPVPGTHKRFPADNATHCRVSRFAPFPADLDGIRIAVITHERIGVALRPRTFVAKALEPGGDDVGFPAGTAQIRGADAPGFPQSLPLFAPPFCFFLAFCAAIGAIISPRPPGKGCVTSTAGAGLNIARGPLSAYAGGTERGTVASFVGFTASAARSFGHITYPPGYRRSSPSPASRWGTRRYRCCRRHSRWRNRRRGCRWHLLR